MNVRIIINTINPIVPNLIIANIANAIIAPIAPKNSSVYNIALNNFFQFMAILV